MKLYMITAESIDEDATAPEVRWAGSQTEAAGVRKALGVAGFRRAEIATHDVEVLTSKGPLIEFLNDLSSGPSIMVATRKLIGK